MPIIAQSLIRALSSGRFQPSTLDAICLHGSFLSHFRDDDIGRLVEVLPELPKVTSLHVNCDSYGPGLMQLSQWMG